MSTFAHKRQCNFNQRNMDDITKKKQQKDDNKGCLMTVFCIVVIALCVITSISINRISHRLDKLSTKVDSISLMLRNNGDVAVDSMCGPDSAAADVPYEEEDEDGEERVFICTSPNATRYHCEGDCAGLLNCSYGIVDITKSQAIKMGRTPCLRCCY